jgi:spore maturation protein A
MRRRNANSQQLQIGGANIALVRAYTYGMRKVWLLMLLSGITALLFINPAAAVGAMVKGSHDAVKLAITLAALYAFWLGFFGILEKTGVSATVARLLSPAVKFLFPGAGEDTKKFITMNMSANLLGLGNAATPMAISAINSMESQNGKAGINMIMLTVISSTSLQLLPSTVIGLRAGHGSANPADFLIPCIIATVFSTVLGITAVKILWRIRRRKA